MKNKLTQGINILEKSGFPIEATRLRTEVGLFTDDYRIAVLGEFKTGKSTFINHFFLKEDILFADLLEATAVPTEISYSTENYLLVYPYKMVKSEIGFGDEKETILTPRELDAPNIFKNPDTDTIRRNTSACGANLEEARKMRSQLARTIGKVELKWNSECLKGLTFIDTPGINSPNEAVVFTTYRIIPTADLVLFLKRANQLTLPEIGFLSSKIFAQGLKRPFIILTYNSKHEHKDIDDLDMIVKSINADMAEAKLPNIPVSSLDMNSLADDDNCTISIEDILNGGNKGDAQSTNTKEELFEKINAYIRDNALAGREERAKTILSRQGMNAIVLLQSELITLKLKKDERNKFAKQVQTETEEIKRKYKELAEDFLTNFYMIESEYKNEISKGMLEIQTFFLNMFDNCDDFASAQSLLNQADFIIKPRMEILFAQANINAQNKVKELLEELKAKSDAILAPLREKIDPGFELDGGVFGKIPPWLVNIADILIVIVLGPFWWPIDLFLRMIISKIPFFNKMLPANIARAIMIMNIKNSLRNEMNKSSKEMFMKIDESFETAKNKIKVGWTNISDTELNRINDRVSIATEEKNPELRIDEIEKTIVELKSLLN